MSEPNPFAPPASERDITTQPWRGRAIAGGYRDPRLLSLLLLVLLAANFAVTVLIGWAVHSEGELLARFAAGDYDEAAAIENDARVELLRGAVLAVRLPTFVVFSLFVRKANINARALGASRMEYTPGWAVGWFFVPVANIIKPFQVVSELWRATDPQHTGDDWHRVSTGPGIVIWWALWLFSFVTNGVVNAEAKEGMLPGLHAKQMVAAAINAAAALAAAYVVYEIYRRQEARAENVFSQGFPPVHATSSGQPSERRRPRRKRPRPRDVT